MIGAEIIDVFKSSGMGNNTQDGSNVDNSQNRLSICADSMRICLLAFQLVQKFERVDIGGCSNAGENAPSQFLSILFAIMVSITNFNGLPNDLKVATTHNYQQQSDPLIGRLCAQTIVHLARNFPATFKACVASMNATPRSALENTMRAEISGYASSSTSSASSSLVKARTGKITFKAFQ
ncbi:MAG: hypothetical protein ACREOZ_00025 [Gloeomargaritales cyanobacterium]